MPTIDLANQDLRLPLNVNDDQIYPGMTHYPVPSEGWTEMSFLAIQTEACRVILPILDAQQQQQHSGEAEADALGEIREKRKLLDDPGRYLAARYGISPGSEESQTSLQRIATQHVMTACKKMEFVLQLREEICLQKQAQSSTSTPDVLKGSFKLACDALESSRVLLKGGLSSRFEWFFSMYTQWYALAYVLRCLRSSPSGLEVDRAWDLVEGLFPHGTNPHQPEHEHAHGRIWRFLKVLRDQAWSLRQKDYNSHVLPDPNLRTAAADYGSCILPEWDNEFIDDPDQFSSTLDLLMPEIPFLPDWNAVVNGL
jgi:hypothetical protein